MNEIKYIKIPTICPYCNSELKIIQNNETKTLNCINNNCPEKLLNKINHFCSKDKGLDIKGLSKATLEKLINWGWVENIIDLFYLENYKEEWMRQPGFGKKSVENILAAINKSKDCELHSFISALGIPLIGSTYAKEIAKKLYGWAQFRDYIEAHFDFTRWDGFGLEMCTSLWKFNYAEADELVKILNLKNSLWKDPNTKNQNINSLDGVKVVITGSLKLFKNRAALQECIENNGGKVISSVSKKTNYLINNDVDSTSSKNKKAKELGIPILSEEDFLNNF